MISKKYVADIELKRNEVESFDSYPFSLAAVRPLEKLEFHPSVTFFIGENGSGKSTLLEAVAVACGFNAEGGSKNFRFGTRESHSELHRFLRVPSRSKPPSTSPPSNRKSTTSKSNLPPFARRCGDTSKISAYSQNSDQPSIIGISTIFLVPGTLLSIVAG